MAAGRIAIGAIALIASVVQLVTVPWPIWVRVGLFVLALSLLAVWLAYVLGGRHASGIPPTSAAEARPPPDLVGESFAKVPRGPYVALCRFRSEQRLDERWIPVGPSTDADLDQEWEGRWWLEDSELHVRVGDFHLGMNPRLDGIWVGSETGPDGTAPFVGAIVDPRVPSLSNSWTGIKIGEHGVRRVVKAFAGGHLFEEDPFGDESKVEGQWNINVNGLQISVHEWSLTVTLRPAWTPGVWLGVERSSNPDQRFAVVRVRTPPA